VLVLVLVQPSCFQRDIQHRRDAWFPQTQKGATRSRWQQALRLEQGISVVLGVSGVERETEMVSWEQRSAHLCLSYWRASVLRTSVV